MLKAVKIDSGMPQDCEICSRTARKRGYIVCNERSNRDRFGPPQQSKYNLLSTGKIDLFACSKACADMAILREV